MSTLKLEPQDAFKCANELGTRKKDRCTEQCSSCRWWWPAAKEE